MKYKVVFNGDLKPGVSKAQTLAVLCKFSGFDAAKAEKVFFSGKPVKLKIIEGEAETKVFLKRLYDMGLAAKVTKLQAEAPSSEPSHKSNTPQTNKAPSKKSTQASSTKVNKARTVARPAVAGAAKPPPAASDAPASEPPQSRSEPPAEEPLAEQAKGRKLATGDIIEQLKGHFANAKTTLIEQLKGRFSKTSSAVSESDLEPQLNQEPDQEPQPVGEPQPDQEPDSKQQALAAQSVAETARVKKEPAFTPGEQKEGEQAEPPAKRKRKLKKTESPKPWKWLMPVLGGFAALVVIVVGVYFFLVSSLISTEVPAQVNKAENALLEANVALLGHINAKRIFELEDLLAKKNGSDYLQEIEFVQLLQAEGANVRAELSQIVFGLHIDETLGSYLSQVLITNTPKSVITNFLKQNYVLESQARGSTEILTFSKQDKQSCRISDPRSLIVGNGFVVISHSQKVYELYQAVNTADEEKVVNEQWLAYRDSHLVSLGILNPQQLEKGLPGMMGFLLMEAQSHWSSMQSVFLGIRGVALPPAIKLDFAIKSDNKQWLQQSHSSLMAIINKHKEAVANNDSNFFSLLMSRVELSQSSSELSSEFTIDQELVNTGTDMLGKGLGSAMVSSMPSDGDAPDPIEIIDENPKQYLPQLSLDQVPPFMNEYKRQYAWADKYFAAYIKSVSINRDGLYAFEVAVDGAKLPNQPNSFFGEAAQLVINDVVNGEGNSILQQETCGMNLNHEPAKFMMNSASKLVRLKPGISINQTALLRARVEAVVPTRTEALMLPVPLTQSIFENAGSKLTISGVNKGSVSYSLSGKRGGFLTLRALNKDKRYLRSGSSFGFSGAMNHEFSGEVAFIEIIKAMESSPISAQIEIHKPDIAFPEDGFTLRPSEPEAYSKEKWSNMLDFSRDFKPDADKRGWYGDPVVYSRSGPAELKLYDPKVFRNFDGPMASAKLEANMPYVRILDDKSNLAKLRVKEIIFDDGTRYTHTSEHPITFTFTGFGNRAKVAELPEERLRKNIYLTGKTSIEIPLLDQVYVDKEIILLTGELSFRIPTAVQSKEFTDITLGKRFEVNEALALEVVELSHAGMKLAARGDASVLSSLQILSQQDRLLEQGVSFEKEQKRFGVKPNSKGEEEPPPRFISSYHYKGKPVKIRVALAESSETFVYPFGLPVKAPD